MEHGAYNKELGVVASVFRISIYFNPFQHISVLSVLSKLLSVYLTIYSTPSTILSAAARHHLNDGKH